MKRRSLSVLFLGLCCGTATQNVVLAQATPMVATADGGCICHAPLIVGAAKGIFAKHDIDLQILKPATGIEAIVAVQNGTAHDGAAAPTVIAQLNAKGKPVKALVTGFGDATGTIATDRYLAIVARPGSGIREGHPEDLKGKKVGVPTGTIAHQYLYYALAAKGVDAIKDVTVQRVIPPDMASNLTSGAIDAITIWEPVVSRVAKAVPNASIVYRGGNHIQFIDFRAELPSFIEANRAAVKRYVSAFVEAAQYTRLHLDEAAEILAADFAKGSDRESVRAVLEMLNFDPRISNATRQSVQQGLDFAVAIGALPRAPSIDDTFDLTILNEVTSEHPEWFSDLPLLR